MENLKTLNAFYSQHVFHSIKQVAKQGPAGAAQDRYEMMWQK